MPWIINTPNKWYEQIAINVIKMGPIPQHIALIMDGNRRFARKANITIKAANACAFNKLSECIKWCLDIGIKEVSAYALSIYNLERTPTETATLLALAKTIADDSMEELEILREKGVRIRIIGDMSLLPIGVQESMAKASLATEENNKLIVNLVCAYTSRDEMTTAIQTILQDCGTDLEPNDINEELITQCLYTNESINPDLLIRTSGETRISDFFMWQITSTLICFPKCLWLNVTLWQFLFGIFQYQRAIITASKFKEFHFQQLAKPLKPFSGGVRRFLDKVNASRRDHLLYLANGKRTE